MALRARWLRALSIVLATAAVLAAASDADAQRRRGRRARRADPTAEPAQSQEAASEEGEESAPLEEPPPAEPPAAPAAPPATQATGQPSASPSAPAPSSPAVSSAPPAAPSEEPGDPGPMPPDLSDLRQEYTALMDEMVQARSRVAILGQELFQARMKIIVQDRTGAEQTLTRFVLELDGTPVHRTDGEIEGGSEGRSLFEGALAPGPHVLTIDMEQRSRDDSEYRVTQRESFRFVVVRDRLTEVTIVLEDDSNIARDFRSGGEGRFEIRTRVRVATRELPRS